MFAHGRSGGALVAVSGLLASRWRGLAARLELPQHVVFVAGTGLEDRGGVQDIGTTGATVLPLFRFEARRSDVEDARFPKHGAGDLVLGIVEIGIDYVQYVVINTALTFFPARIGRNNVQKKSSGALVASVVRIKT